MCSCVVNVQPYCMVQNFDREILNKFLEISQNFTIQVFLQQMFVCKNDPIHQIFTRQSFLTPLHHNFATSKFCAIRYFKPNIINVNGFLGLWISDFIIAAL